MLPTGFANSETAPPDLRAPLARIAEWCDKNAALSEIDPRRLVREVHLDETSLLQALLHVVQRGLFEWVFRFEMANGEVLHPGFRHYRQIPVEWREIEARDEGRIIAYLRAADTEAIDTDARID